MEIRNFLAWKSIKNESVDLNLDAAQNRQTDNALKRSNETVEARIKESWCWLIVPYIDRQTDIKTILWDVSQISGGTDSIITKSAKKLIQSGSVIPQWAPSLLLMELNNVLWKDKNDIQIKKLWEYLCTYCYLPRLANFSVLENAIRIGVNSIEYFAFAAAFDGKRYMNLKFNQAIDIVEPSGLLVKNDIAQNQLAEEANKKVIQSGQPVGFAPPSGPRGDGSNSPSPGDGVSEVSPDFTPTLDVFNNKHFYMTAHLDNTRINRDVQKLVEEVISHLLTLNGSATQISLEVDVTTPDGIPSAVVRTVSENCRTLKVQDFGFDE